MERVVIRDKDGDPVYSGKNLRVLREFIGKGNPVEAVIMDPLPEKEAKLKILFKNGYFCEVHFVSVWTLKQTLRNWRNLEGAPLIYYGAQWGTIGPKNLVLRG